jgi:DNA-binding transcriptional LysR family regulator
LEFGTFEGIVACAAAGMGMAMMPRLLLEERKLDDSVRLHTLPPRFVRVPTLLVWRKDAEHHAAREAFFEALEAMPVKAAPMRRARVHA